MSASTQIFGMDGKVVLVTGAGQGVGKATAQLLSAFGATVVVNDYFADRAQAVAEEIRSSGGSAVPLQGDVTSFDGVSEMFRLAIEKCGKVDVLVNNAGNSGSQNIERSARRAFWETSPEDWKPYVSVNLDGVLNCSRHALPGMIERKSGRIVTIISDAGRVGQGSGLEAYSAAKAGAAGFTRGLARTVGRYGITANNIAISATNTPAVAVTFSDPAVLKAAMAQYVIRRLGEPSDVAAMVLFLASDASSWITGQTYPVNGGFSFNM